MKNKFVMIFGLFLIWLIIAIVGCLNVTQTSNQGVNLLLDTFSGLGTIIGVFLVAGGIVALIGSIYIGISELFAKGDER